MWDRATKKRTVIQSSVIVLAMFGFGYGMVPIYDVFCNLTGLNGNTENVKQVSTESFKADPSRTVRVQFVSNVGAQGAWNFEPEVFEMNVHPGQAYTTSYTAKNLRRSKVVGQAIPSVMPAVASLYFHKTECFCFNNQLFTASEEREMPVTFIVNPQLPPDVETLTLSYTFFDVTHTVQASETTSNNQSATGG